jgi:hypothetical protein
MNFLSIIIALLFFLSFPMDLDARGKSNYKRSSSARSQFIKTNPCPLTGQIKGVCPGYVIDHVVPLKRGGADHLSNVQWQTKEETKQKDKWE